MKKYSLKKSVKIATVVMGSVVLAACFEPPSEFNRQLALQSWHGSNIDNLVGTWGYPTSQQIAPNGNTVYSYNEDEQGTTPVYTRPASVTRTEDDNGKVTVRTQQGYSTGGDFYHRTCNNYFEVDSSNTVIMTGFNGNYCAVGKDFIDRYGNPFAVFPVDNF